MKCQLAKSNDAVAIFSVKLKNSKWNMHIYTHTYNRLAALKVKQATATILLLGDQRI